MAETGGAFVSGVDEGSTCFWVAPKRTDCLRSTSEFFWFARGSLGGKEVAAEGEEETVGADAIWGKAACKVLCESVVPGRVWAEWDGWRNEMFGSPMTEYSCFRIRSRERSKFFKAVAKMGQRGWVWSGDWWNCSGDDSGGSSGEEGRLVSVMLSIDFLRLSVPC